MAIRATESCNKIMNSATAGYRPQANNNPILIKFCWKPTIPIGSKLSLEVTLTQ